jgi:transposase
MWRSNPGPPSRLRMTSEGIAEAVARLQAVQPTLIVLEATGGLEVPLTGALAAAGLPVVVLNPRQVRDFARATGPVGEDGSARCPDPRPVRRSHSSPRSARSPMNRRRRWPRSSRAVGS